MTKNILIIGSEGYIGSALVPRLRSAFPCNVQTLDIGWFGGASGHQMDMFDAPRWFIHTFDVVILLAGHSSVPMSTMSSVESVFRNNVENFVALVSKLSSHQKFIYASSASVYNGISGLANENATLLNTALNSYDITKRHIDDYIQLFDVEYYGLRFGTVNGVSPHLRTDIMINGMVNTAQTAEKITISNPHIRRPILGINDLCRAIETIINGNDHRGIYNLSSFNSTVGEIGADVSRALNIPLVEVASAASVYDFWMDTTKFEQTYNFAFTSTTFNLASDLKTQWNCMRKSHRNVNRPYSHG